MNFDSDIQDYISIKQSIKSLESDINSQMSIQNSMYTYSGIQKQLLYKDLENFEKSFNSKNAEYYTLISKIKNRFLDFNLFESEILAMVNTRPNSVFDKLYARKHNPLKIPYSKSKSIINRIETLQFEYEQTLLKELKEIKQDLEKKTNEIDTNYERDYANSQKIVNDRFSLLKERKEYFEKIQTTIIKCLENNDFNTILKSNEIPFLSAIEEFLKDSLSLLHLNETTTKKRNTYSNQIDLISNKISELKNLDTES